MSIISAIISIMYVVNGNKLSCVMSISANVAISIAVSSAIS